VALAVERAEKIRGGEIPFQGVAFVTAGNEVAVGIIAELGTRDDMVEATGKGGKPAETIKTTAAFSSMDGAAQGWMPEEVQILVFGGGSLARKAVCNPTVSNAANLAGQADLDHVARFVALHQTQDAAGDEAADRPADGTVGETSAISKPGNGKAEATASLEAAVT
jgi:hypothetical protein